RDGQNLHLFQSICGIVRPTMESDRETLRHRPHFHFEPGIAEKTAAINVKFRAHAAVLHVPGCAQEIRMTFFRSNPPDDANARRSVTEVALATMKIAHAVVNRLHTVRIEHAT